MVEQTNSRNPEECVWCGKRIERHADSVFDDLTDGFYHPQCFELVEEFAHNVREAFRKLEREEA